MEKIIEFVKKELAFDKSGHGIQHAMRVYNNAKKIMQNENANEKIVLTSALVHDCIDHKLFSDIEAQQQKIINLLKELNYTNEEIDEIVYIINNISWKGGKNAELNSLNAKIVRDADRLDALGVMGIVRTIEYGCAVGRNFYDEENIKFENGKYTFNKITVSSLSHFYEKLLLLKDYLHTDTAKQIAQKRHEFMEEFLEEFYSEL